MFAQSYNPLGVTDSFYLIKQPFRPDEQHRKQQMARRHVSTKKKGLQTHQIFSALHRFGEDEEEMRQCRLHILKKYMNKCESEYLHEEREEMNNDWHSDPGCVPREVNVILAPSSSSSEPHTKPNSQDKDEIVCDEDNCFSVDDVPHLIGVDEEDD